MDLLTLGVLGLVVALGSFVQSSIGFGVAVVAAPVIVLVDPTLMPVAMLVCGFVLPFIHLVREPRDIDRQVLGWGLAGRALLTPAGVYLVTVLSPETIGAVVGGMVLLAVLLSLRTVPVRATRRNAAVAGVLTGVSGTAASIGGPFLALVLQHENPIRIRSTLAAFFTVGAALALVALAVAGEVHTRQLVAGVTWIPFLFLGHALAGPVRARLDHTHMRYAVLALATLTSLTVILRALTA